MTDPDPPVPAPACPHCQHPLPGWTPPSAPGPIPPREPGYAEHHPQEAAGHVSGRAQPPFAPGWLAGPTASDPDAHGLLRGIMNSFTREEEAG